MKIFISSVQKEFANERNALGEYLAADPLLAEPLYLAKYIERMGTGTRDMIRNCIAVGLAEPEFTLTNGFVTTIQRPLGPKPVSEKAQVEAQEAQVGAQVQLTPIELDMLKACDTTPRSGQQLLEIAGYASRTGNFKRSMDKLLQSELLSMTIPEKPTSRLQQYRLTQKGRALLEQLTKEEESK